MANTTADKLALLEATKAEMKSAINGSGSTVGDVFSAYPAAITSGKAAIAQATTNKGVATAATDTFAQMAANIEQIETGTPVEFSDITITGSGLSGAYITKNFTFYVDGVKNTISLETGTIQLPKNAYVVVYCNAIGTWDVSSGISGIVFSYSNNCLFEILGDATFDFYSREPF